MKDAKDRPINVWTIAFSGLAVCSLLVTHCVPDVRLWANVATSPVGNSVRSTTNIGTSSSDVMLKFTLDNRQVAIVTQLVGNPIRVEFNGCAIAIVPQVGERDPDQVTSKIFKMLPGAMVAERRQAKVSASCDCPTQKEMPLNDVQRREVQRTGVRAV